MKRVIYDLLDKLMHMSKNYGFLRGLFILTKLKLNKSGKVRLPDVSETILIRPETSDKHTFHQIFTYNHYKFDLPFEPQVIIDGGANIGLASLYFKNQFPNASIIAIEPEQSNYDMLVKNLDKYNDVTPYKNALSNIPDQVLEVVDHGGGNWGMMTLEKGAQHEGGVLGAIETITLNDIIDKHKIAIIDLLKIDIEGAEKELFSSGYESWLPKTRCLIVELHDRMREGTSKSVFSAINKYDFSFDYQGENLIFFNKELV